MRATWRTVAVGLSVALVGVAGVVLVAGGDDAPRSVTDHGIRWTKDTPFVVITATDRVDPATRALLRGRLVVSCQTTSGSQGALAPRGLGLALGSVRFTEIPQTVRVALSPPPRKFDTCALERPGIADDVSAARFVPAPALDDGMLIVR